jgi:uncharacterized protein YecE (DUF72 family)
LSITTAILALLWREFRSALTMKNKFHIGTSGWSYKDWVGEFYPVGMKSTDWLTFYAKTFDCTEINNSFYRLPQKQTVINWVEKVPKGFLFCPKMSKFLTHNKRLKEPEEPLERFFGIFEPMKKNMGPVLIQLPNTVRFDYDVAQHFYKLLKEKYTAYNFAMEVRHPTWFTEESYTLMTKYNVSFVMSHSGNHFPYAETITAHDIYFRFHGPGSLYNTKYTDAEMKKFAIKFRKWLKQGHELWIFFNNDWYGYGIENGLYLRKLLEK